MEYPTRSAQLSSRFGNNSQGSDASVHAFGAASQTSSTTTTSYPSPTNDSGSAQNSSRSIALFQYTPQLNTQLNTQSSMSPSHLNAPLPSPSAGDMNPMFGRALSQPNPCQPVHSQYQPHQNQQAPLSNPPADQHPPPHPHHNAHSKPKHISQPGALPPNFLAEAAKRAEMACLMRDLGEVAL